MPDLAVVRLISRSVQRSTPSLTVVSLSKNGLGIGLTDTSDDGTNVLSDFFCDFASEGESI